MEKRCSCGRSMKLALRTVVYAKTVNIANVPVYECDGCSRNEVFPGVKREVGELVGQLGVRPLPQTIPFDQLHEWACVLQHAIEENRPLHAHALARAAEERTNELLDLLLIATSLQDEAWMAEIRGRLAQLSEPYIV